MLKSKHTAVLTGITTTKLALGAILKALPANHSLRGMVEHMQDAIGDFEAAYKRTSQRERAA